MAPKKILIAGDIHIPNAKQISSIKINDEIKEIINTFDLINETADRTKPDYILFLGDIFDTPTGCTTDMVNITLELFRKLAVNNSIGIIQGNHDCTKNDTIGITDSFKYKPSLLNILYGYANIISTPTITDEGNYQIIFMPYENDTKKEFENLKKTKEWNNNKPKICFGHFEWKNNTYHKLLESSEGLLSPKELLDNYGITNLICGHIHDSDRIIESTNGKQIECTYIGSCRNINFTNIQKDKHIGVIEIDDNGNIDWLELVDNPYTPIYQTFNSWNELENYVNSYSMETLARTNIKLKYTDGDELKNLTKIKSQVKTVKIEKNVKKIKMDTDKVNINKEDLAELGSLLQNSLIDKKTIIDYSLKFNEPNNKDSAVKLLNILSDKK